MAASSSTSPRRRSCPSASRTPAPPIWCKLEFLNPSGSTKDRIARYMLEKAWRQGELLPGGDGHRGVQRLDEHRAGAGLRADGPALHRGDAGGRHRRARASPSAPTAARWCSSPKAEGIRGAIARDRASWRASAGAFPPRQFANPDNAEAHRVWTGQEILSQIPGGAGGRAW